MKKTIRNITLMLAAALVITGCELNDSGGLQMIPPGAVEQAAGADATLKSLAVDNFTISPAFDAETLEYTLVVSKATTSSLTVRAIGPDGAAVSVAINGGSATPVTEPGYSAVMALEDTLDVNDIVASVVSEDTLSTNEYHIRVYYLGTSASLSGLDVTLTNGSPGAISSGLDPSFDPAHLTYAAGISYATTSIDITVSMPEGSGMTATVDGWTALSGSPVPITNLPAAGGSRDITITVTSQDEGTTRDYTLTISKGAAPSTEARLSALVFRVRWYLDLVSSYTIKDIGFSCDDYILSYNRNMDTAWRAFRFTATPMSSDFSSISARGTCITGSQPLISNGDGSYTITIDLGYGNSFSYPQTVYIDVTAEDEVTVKTYSITVNN